MAIIEGLLTEAQILGFRGVIDFYYHRGRIVAREWPKKRTLPPRTDELIGQTFFGAVNTSLKDMSEPNREEWRKFVVGRNIAWPDAVRKFRMLTNPNKVLWPHFYIDHIDYRQTGDIRWADIWFRKDANYFEPTVPLNCRFLDGFTPVQPVTWQAVGYKRRRRAIMDQVIRPQFTGWEKNTAIQESPDPELIKFTIFSQNGQRHFGFYIRAGGGTFSDVILSPMYRFEWGVPFN